MGYPQTQTHWSAYHPIVHTGPVEDCPDCEDERARFEGAAGEQPEQD